MGEIELGLVGGGLDGFLMYHMYYYYSDAHLGSYLVFNYAIDMLQHC